MNTPAFRPFEHQVLRKVSPRLRKSKTEWLGIIPCRMRLGGRLSDLEQIQIGSLCIITTGTETQVEVSPKELFRAVLGSRCDGFYLVHNHPSGSLIPSEEDHELTWRTHQLAQVLAVPLLGHWIVSEKGNGWVDTESKLDVDIAYEDERLIAHEPTELTHSAIATGTGPTSLLQAQWHGKPRSSRDPEF